MKYVLFTDAASFNNGQKDPSKPQHSYSGAILTYNGEIIKKFGHFNPNTTNNYGEIFAIYYGIKSALKYLNGLGVNDIQLDVYSDSEICVRGLNEWIYSWIKNSDSNGVWYNSSKVVVSNQEIFKKIDKILRKRVRPIFKNKPVSKSIQVFHVKGHVNNNKDFIKAIKTFKRVNGIDVPSHILEFLVRMNNEVDKYAVKKLQKKLGEINIK